MTKINIQKILLIGIIFFTFLHIPPHFTKAESAKIEKTKNYEELALNQLKETDVFIKKIKEKKAEEKKLLLKEIKTLKYNLLHSPVLKADTVYLYEIKTNTKKIEIVPKKKGLFKNLVAIEYDTLITIE